MASPICLRLLLQLVRLAASRALWTAGMSKPIKMEMMAITTSNSISVKPERHVRMRIMIDLQEAGLADSGPIRQARWVRPPHHGAGDLKAKHAATRRRHFQTQIGHRSGWRLKSPILINKRCR